MCVENLSPAFFTLLIFASTVLPLKARVRCIGPACDTVPADDARRQTTFLSLQFQYQNILRRENLRAAMNTNVSRENGGGRRLKGYSVGLGSGTAWTAESRVNAHVPGSGSFVGLPVSGMAVQPSLSLGGTLSRIFRDVGLEGGSDSIFSADRFDLYVHFVHTRTEDHNFAMPRENRVEGGTFSRGAEVRYFALKERDLRGERFRFLGLSLGIGVVGTNSHLTIQQSAKQSGYLPHQPSGAEQPIVWNQSNEVSMKSTITSIPVELRSGVTVLRFLDLYAGAGIASHSGLGRFSTVASGGFSYASNATGVGEGASLGFSPHADGGLAALLSGKTHVQTTKGFARFGIGAGTESLRASLEWTWDPHAQGIFVGLRAQF